MPRTRLRHFILHSILFHIFLGVVITLALIYLFDKETGTGGGQAGGRLEPIVVTVIEDGDDSKKDGQKTSEELVQEKQERKDEVVEETPDIPEDEIAIVKKQVVPQPVQKSTQKKTEQIQEETRQPEIQNEVASITDTGESDQAQSSGTDSEIEAKNDIPGEVALNLTEGARPDYGSNPTPPYPKSARRRGYEGTVLLRVLVLENGKVGEIEVKSPSGHSVLDKSALKAVSDWTFIPGKKAGQSIQTWVEVPIKYQLDSG